jgi:hypothetical protein
MKRAPVALTVGLIGSLLFVVGAHGQTKIKKDPLPFYEDRDGYEVLSVLLNARAEKLIRIAPRTASPSHVAAIKAQCAGIPPEFQGASEDFDKKAQTRFLLRRDFTLKNSYELASASAGTGADHLETKEGARGRIPFGTYYVAAVGFDEKRSRAMAFVEYICGNLCGSSLFHYLRKSAKGWEEASDVLPKVQGCGRIY